MHHVPTQLTASVQCNKQWPCNHCQKRKVASKCSFGQGIASPPSLDSSVSQGGSTRKRQLSHEDHAEQQLDSNPWDDADWDFESLGYTPSHLHVGLGVGSTVCHSSPSYGTK